MRSLSCPPKSASRWQQQVYEGVAGAQVFPLTWRDVVTEFPLAGDVKRGRAKRERSE